MEKIEKIIKDFEEISKLIDGFCKELIELGKDENINNSWNTITRIVNKLMTIESTIPAQLLTLF